MLGTNVNSFWNLIKSRRKNNKISLIAMKYQNKKLQGDIKIFNGFVKHYKSIDNDIST